MLVSVYETMTPEDGLRELRETSPVHFDEVLQGWRILRYDDARRVLRDSETFSAKVPWPDPVPIYLFMDEPDHRRYRAPTEVAFRDLPARAADIERHVDECLDAVISRGAMDLGHDLAKLVPARAVFDLLGVPRSDEEMFHQQFEKFDTGRVETAGASGEFYSYFADRIKLARSEPGEGLISHVASLPDFTDDDKVGICVQIMAAGIAAARHLVTWFFMVTTQADHDLIRSDWGLLPGAIEETLRLRPPLNTVYRVTTRAVTLSGQEIPAGAMVLPTVLSANRDPAVFADPAVFDLHRRPNPHLTFGAGVHTCQGSGMARMEGRVILRRLLERLDDIRVIDPSSLQLIAGLNYGLTGLPITFTPR